MNNPFRKAERSQVFLKDAITGPTGSGKTFSALRLAFGLVADTEKRVAFLDTENDSASLYSDQFDFDVMPIAPPFAAETFRDGINAAVAADYGCVIIDSASHLWKGILEYKGKIDERGGNQYTNWRDPDKKFNEALDAVLQSKIHVIFCLRSKMEYVMEDNGKGKQAPKRVGLAPIMREGIEFEFTTVFDVAMNHEAVATKDRSGMFPVDKYFQITEDTGRQIAAWLKTAKPKSEPTPAPTPGRITDEAAKTGNVAKLRGILDKNRGEHSLGEFEKSFAAVASHQLPEPRGQDKLEDFTLDELRALWPKRAEIIAHIHQVANGAIAK